MVTALALVGAAVHLAAALAVIKRRSGDETSFAYFVSAIALAALFVGIALPEWGLLLRTGAWMFLPVAVWWVAATFGRAVPRGRRRHWLLTGTAVLLIVLALVFMGQPYPSGDSADEGAPWGRWAALLGVGFWLASSVNLLLTARGAVGEPRLRRATGICALTALLPLWPATLTASSGTLPVYGLWMVAVTQTGTLLVAAEWLLRHHAREGDLQFGRPVSYASFAVFLFGLYLVLIGAVGKSVEWLGGDLRAFFSALGGVLVAVLGLALATSGRLWERLRGFVDRNFYRGEFDFRADWMRISEELASLPDPRDLGATLSRLLGERVAASTVLLYRRQDSGHFELWSQRGGDGQAPERLDIGSRWADWLWRLGAPVDWAIIEAPDKPASLTEQTRLVVPLIAKQEIVALACLGGRKEAFTTEERLWLEAAGQQAALAVLAANLTERLIETRELASFHRMSTFVIHDVKNAVSMLSLLLQNLERGKASAEVEDIEVTVRQATQKLTALIDRFSGARESFKISRRPVNCRRLLEQAVEKVAKSFPRVNVTLPSTDIMLSGDPEQLLRILENLCINACEAMQGTGKLTLRVESKPGATELIVADTGPGMDDDFMRERLFRPFATTKKKGLGIGLYQCREIARAHGGELAAQSVRGQGATFILSVPSELEQGKTAEGPKQ